MDFRSFFNFKKLDDLNPQTARNAILALVFLIILMGLSSLVAFSLAIKGSEKTLVPNVVDMELSSALIKLQEKELYPRLSLRFDVDPSSKGRVLEQDPLPGAIVKAGRRIALVVSRGAVQDKIGDYIGLTIDEVKIHLQTVFGSTRQLITVKEPAVYIFDKSPAGTILEQSPSPETEISGPTQLDFVVSRGPEKPRIIIPDFAGLSLENAVKEIEKTGMAFQFTIRPAEGKEKPGTIVAQLPAPSSMEEQDNPVSLVFAAPAKKEGMTSGLFSQELPIYPYPLTLSLYAETPSGSRITLITVDHPGKQFTLPYELPLGSVLVLQVLNKIVARMEVR